MAFMEVLFPTATSFGATGGPGFRTGVNEGYSGFEKRNKAWAFARSKWVVSLDKKSKAYFDIVYSFFLNVGGQADGFRFKDHKDYSFTNQALGTGNGILLTFQLVKKYVLGSRTYTRTITKPVTSSVKDFQGNSLTNTVKVYVNGVLQTSGVTVDHTTGIVTFDSAPSGTITADGEFHFPARFATDDLNAVFEESDTSAGKEIISWGSIPIIEIRI